MDQAPNRGEDLRGKTFGLWTVLEYVGKIGKSRHAYWRVQCGCPLKKIKEVVGTTLTNGHSKSCGCLRVEAGKKNATHGMTKSPEYQAWLKARRRTRDPNDPSFMDYGGRIPPITMTDELYDSFPAWFAEVGPKISSDHSIDRKNNDRGYEPGNLKWSTATEQALNRRTNKYITYNGERRTYSEWDKKMSFPKGTVKNRMKLGWSIEKILTTPVRAKMKSPAPGEATGLDKLIT